MSGAARTKALTTLSTRLHAEANAASDAPRAHKLATAVGDLAKARA